MVKVEKDPYHNGLEFAHHHVKKIQSILPPNHFLHWTRIIERDFEGNLESKHTITEKRFFRKKKVEITHILAKVEFKAYTMELFLAGKEDELRDIAQKLEENGYNVTIWI